MRNFFEKEKHGWLCRRSHAAFNRMPEKGIPSADFETKVRFNPKRIRSSKAKASWLVCRESWSPLFFHHRP
jgi:hypothetical protein